MEMLKKYKMYLVVLGLLVAVGAWFSLGSGDSSATLLTTNQSTTAGVGDQNLVNTLLTLRTVSLSGAVFQNPAFVGLQDFTTQIVNEPLGRPDPFAPLASSLAPALNPQAFAIIRSQPLFSPTSTAATSTASTTAPTAPAKKPR